MRKYRSYLKKLYGPKASFIFAKAYLITPCGNNKKVTWIFAFRLENIIIGRLKMWHRDLY